MFEWSLKQCGQKTKSSYKSNATWPCTTQKITSKELDTWNPINSDLHLSAFDRKLSYVKVFVMYWHDNVL